MAFKSKRKEILINRKVQLTMLTLFVFGHGVLLAIYFFTTIYTSNFIKENLISSPVQMAAFENWANDVFLLSEVLLVTVITSAILFFIFTHRIAGPIWCIKKRLDGLSKGEPYDNVKFRKYDYFMELEESYNKYMAHCRGEPITANSVSTETETLAASEQT